MPQRTPAHFNENMGVYCIPDKAVPSTTTAPTGDFRGVSLDCSSQAEADAELLYEDSVARDVGHVHLVPGLVMFSAFSSVSICQHSSFD